MFVICFCSVLLSMTVVCNSICEPNPEQIHLSLAASSSEMMITWITYCPSLNTHVMYGIGDTKIRVKGNSTEQYRNGKMYYVHRTLLKRLKPDQRYLYRCGNDMRWSSMYTFKTLKEGEEWSPSLAVFGDLRHQKRHTIMNLMEDVKNHKYNALYNIGAFDNGSDSTNGQQMNEFFREIESITARVPYLTVPTKATQINDFSSYNQRLSMINAADRKINNYYYSVNIATAHIISISTEFYYAPQTQSVIQAQANQFEWLENDLIEANKFENRKKRPWIITMAHRPMVCSDHIDDCISRNFTIMKAFEDLFYKYGVDLEMWGGGHSYRRFWPFYNFKVHNGSLKEPYKNPKAPVHIITAFKDGTSKARCNKFIVCSRKTEKLIAANVNENGYTRITVVNTTHLHIKHILPSRKTPVDEIMIVKHSHGSYISSNDCNTSQSYSRELITSLFIFYTIYYVN